MFEESRRRIWLKYAKSVIADAKESSSANTLANFCLTHQIYVKMAVICLFQTELR